MKSLLFSLKTEDNNEKIKNSKPNNVKKNFGILLQKYAKL
jgi:hypothetical protein